MENSALLDAFRSFSEPELKEFGKFVRSPFHNERKDVTDFFNIIKKQFPDFRGKGVLKETLFRKMYPGKAYNDAVMRRLSSFLLKVSEEYMAYSRFRKSGHKHELSLLKELNEKNILSLFNKNLKKLERKFGNFVPPAEEYFLDRYYISEEKINNYLNTSRVHLVAGELRNYSDMLVSHTLVALFQNMYSLYLHEKDYNADFSGSLFETFLKEINFDKIIARIKTNYPHFIPLYQLTITK